MWYALFNKPIFHALNQAIFMQPCVEMGQFYLSAFCQLGSQPESCTSSAVPWQLVCGAFVVVISQVWLLSWLYRFQRHSTFKCLWRDMYS